MIGSYVGKPIYLYIIRDVGNCFEFIYFGLCCMSVNCAFCRMEQTNMHRKTCFWRSIQSY